MGTGWREGTFLSALEGKHLRAAVMKSWRRRTYLSLMSLRCLSHRLRLIVIHSTRPLSPTGLWSAEASRAADSSL